MRSAKNTFSQTMFERKMNVLSVLVAVLMTGALFTATACRSTNDVPISNPDPARATLPADSHGNLQLMSSSNLAGANLVVTDGNAIYFNDRSGSFVRAQADGEAPVALVNGPVSWPFLVEDQLFYADGTGSGQLSKIMSDGSNRVRIGQNELSNIIVFEDEIYAIELPEGRMIRLQPDGSKREELTQAAINSMIRYEQYFYMAGKSAEDGLMRYDPENEEFVRLQQLTVGSLQAGGETLYYADLQNHYQIYAIPLAQDQETSAPSLVLEQSVEKPFIVANNRLYFIDGSRQQQLYSLELRADAKLDPGEAVLEVDDAVENFAALLPFIYYQRPDQDRIYRVTNGQQRPQPIS